MGMREVEALNLARNIAMFNSEAIHYVKNSLYEMTPAIEKRLNEEAEKHRVTIQSKFPNTDHTLLIANTTNNKNHNLMKLDVELIKDTLLEGDNA